MFDPPEALPLSGRQRRRARPVVRKYGLLARAETGFEQCEQPRKIQFRRNSGICKRIHIAVGNHQTHAHAAASSGESDAWNAEGAEVSKLSSRPSVECLEVQRGDGWLRGQPDLSDIDSDPKRHRPCDVAKVLGTEVVIAANERTDNAERDVVQKACTARN